MNLTVELVNHWGAFEEKHPGGSITDFCRYMLIQEREKESQAPVMQGIVPRHADGLLLKLMGRISRLNAIYAEAALKGTGVDRLEEFGMLLTIHRQQQPRKTDVIYMNLQELSSGTDMLNRLKAKGYLTEMTDEDDRRSKRLKLTASGEKVIGKCAGRMGKVANMMLHEMAEDDKQLCILLLKQIDIKFAARWQHDKGKPFDDIYESVMAGK